MKNKKLLFVCIENAGRSQMAAAFARKLGFIAESAGTMPASRVNPIVVQVMEEKGFDLSSVVPKLLTFQMIENTDLVFTMGCSVENVCPRPIIQQLEKKLIDWHLDDPKDKPLTEVRRIRDEIECKVMGLASQLLPTRKMPSVQQN